MILDVLYKIIEFLVGLYNIYSYLMYVGLALLIFKLLTSLKK